MGKKARTAITPTRAEDFPQWYQNVIRAADLAENAPVRGCMIIKPYGYRIWELIQRQLDDMIKDHDVQNAYFPLLIPLSFIAKEAEHVDGFATECAVVTHHRLAKNEEGVLAPSSPLNEPMIIRPTSETIIGEAFSNWVQSYRDLPLKINQWANVMRWEMRPRMFLRTSEFLWQEGHNCFETAEEAHADSMAMLDMYADFAENILAMPVIKGEKTPDERFPGAIATYTIEALMQDGKALQSGTSHNLGQTFSRSANITYQDRDGSETLAWTTSWGMSTRTIGGLIMTHADDDGMVVPPRVAPYQVSLLPLVRNDEDSGRILEFTKALEQRLKEQGIRVETDDRDVRAPDKIWGCIKKGVPVRVEIGGREVDENRVTFARRDLGKEGKTSTSVDEFVGRISDILEDMQSDLLNKARAWTNGHIHDVADLNEMRDFFANGNIGLTRIDVDAIQLPEFEDIKKQFALTPRCMPFEDDGKVVVVGKSY